MPVRSRRIFGPVSCPANTFTTVFTCPADRTAIIKDLYAGLQGLTTGTLYGYLGAHSNGTQFLIRSVPLTPSLIERGLFLVLKEGELLQFFPETTAMTIVGSGALLDGDPA